MCIRDRYGIISNYSEAYISSKNVSDSFEGKGEEITEVYFRSWCAPEDDHVQKYIDEMKAIPIIDQFNKKYSSF